MGRIYTVSGENLTITTTLPLFQMMPSATELNAGGSFKIKRIEISQRGTATAEMVGFMAGVRTTGTTFTLTSVTPVPLNKGGVASAFTGGTDGTAALSIGMAASVDTSGAYATVFYNWNFCNLNGMLWIPTPGEEIIMHASASSLGNFVIKPTVAPGTLTGWTFNVVWEEL